MTIALPDFASLTAVQFVVILTVVALIDFVTGVLGALRDKTFSWQILPQIAETHGVARILPIGGLFAVGTIGAIPALCFAAAGLLAAYFVETIQSALTNLSKPAAPPPA